MKLFQDCANRNVPEKAEVIGSIITMSGEIVETYFWENDDIYKVADWIGDKPTKLGVRELTLLIKIILRIINQNIKEINK